MVRTIDVVDESGQFLCTVVMEPTASLDDLKALIEKERNIPRSSQKLFMGDEELLSAGRVGALGDSDKTIEIVVKLRDEHVAAVMQDLLENCTAFSVIPRWYSELPEEDRGNVEIALEVVSRNGEALRDASPELRDTPAVVITALRNYGQGLEWVSEKLKKDRQVVMTAVCRSGLALRWASEELRSDPSIVKAAVARDPRAAKHALIDPNTSTNNDVPFATAEAMDTVFEIMGLMGHICTVSVESTATLMQLKAAIERETSIPKWEQKLLFQGREFRVMADLKKGGVDKSQPVNLMLVQRNPEVAKKLEELAAAPVSSAVAVWLRSQDGEMQNEFDIVLEAVTRAGEALEYAAPDLRRNKDIILAAIANNSLALRFANSDLRGDKEVVLTAVRREGIALEFASVALRADREVVREAVKNDHVAIQFASVTLQEDAEILHIAGAGGRSCINCAMCVVS